MVMVTIITPGIFSIIVVLGITTGIEGSRIIRSAVIAIKEDAYVAAASSIGGSTRTILLRHILPNILAPTIVLFSLRVPGAILSEAGSASWASASRRHTRAGAACSPATPAGTCTPAPHLVIWPGVALAVVVYGTNMFGDALRDILDPRLRGGAGRFGGSKIEKGRRQRMAQLNRGAPSGSLNGGKAQAPSISTTGVRARGEP